MRASAGVGQLIEYPLTRHSAKPPIVRKKIMVLMGGGAAIELFARSGAAGWDCWGNEAQDENAPPVEEVVERDAGGQLSLFDVYASGSGL